MNYQDYWAKAKAASDLNDQGQREAAIAGFLELVDSDISDLDKALMCGNIAKIYEAMDRPEEVLTWYDRAIAYEQPYFRVFHLETKAAFLANRNFNAEALAIYQFLLEQPYTYENEKERFWNNIGVLQRAPRKIGG